MAYTERKLRGRYSRRPHPLEEPLRQFDKEEAPKKERKKKPELPRAERIKQDTIKAASNIITDLESTDSPIAASRLLTDLHILRMNPELDNNTIRTLDHVFLSSKADWDMAHPNQAIGYDIKALPVPRWQDLQNKVAREMFAVDFWQLDDSMKAQVNDKIIDYGFEPAKLETVAEPPNPSPTPESVSSTISPLIKHGQVIHISEDLVFSESYGGIMPAREYPTSPYAIQDREMGEEPWVYLQKGTEMTAYFEDDRPEGYMGDVLFYGEGHETSLDPEWITEYKGSMRPVTDAPWVRRSITPPPPKKEE